MRIGERRCRNWISKPSRKATLLDIRNHSTRKYKGGGGVGWRLPGAAGFAMFMAVVAQVVILLSTAASYVLGIASYFNHPTALNQPEAVSLAQAMGLRAGGLVVNALLNGIAGSLGWALGGLLPDRGKR